MESKGQKRKNQEGSEKTYKRGKEKQAKPRSAKGEHVINTGVITIYKDIALEFLEKKAPHITIENFLWDQCFSYEMDVYKCIQKPLSDEIRELIESSLKVDIPPGVAYSNKNAERFGKKKSELVKAVANIMVNIHYGSDDIYYESDIESIITEFIGGKYFVDEEALTFLLRENETMRKDYDKARFGVENMLRHLLTPDLIETWVKELAEVIENWNKVVPSK